MTLPGYTAEVAADSPTSAYRTVVGGSLEGGVVAAAFGALFPLIRCCRRSPFFGNRFVCVQHRQRPGETCTCTGTLSGPLITCKDNVLTF
jgi:hypothetical protein